MKKQFSLPAISAPLLRAGALLVSGVLLVSCKPAATTTESGTQAPTEAQVAAQKQAEANKSQELIEQIEALKSESAQLREKLADTKKQGGNAGGLSQRPGLALPEEGASEAGADAKSSEGAAGSFMKGVAKMFTDPEMKKVMRGQQGMVVKMMYGDLARELGLSTEEANQVMELLTDRQMEQAASGMKAMDGGKMDEKKIEEMTQGAKVSTEEYDRQLENVLGKERFGRMKEYEKSMVDRMALSQLQQQFSLSGSPLEAKQSQGLLSIMKEERSKMPVTAFDPTNKDAGAQIKALRSDQELEKYFTNQQEFNRRVLERSRMVLNPDQVKAFESAQKQQLEMQQMGLKMSKEMFKDAGKTAP